MGHGHNAGTLKGDLRIVSESELSTRSILPRRLQSGSGTEGGPIGSAAPVHGGKRRTKDHRGARVSLEHLATLPLLHRAAEATGDAILVWDKGRRVRYANPAARGMFGVDVGQQLPQTRFLMERVSLADARGNLVECKMASFLATLERGGKIENLEGSYMDAAGRRRDIRCNCAPLLDAQGRLWGVTTIGRDVATVRAFEEERRRAARHEAMARLAGSIAHDFNNLLTVMLGNLSLALEDAPESIAELLSAAQDAVLAAKELTNRLTLPQPTTSGPPPALALRLLLRQVCAEALSGTRWTSEIEVDCNLPPVAMAPADLSEVLGTLVRAAAQQRVPGAVVRIHASSDDPRDDQRWVRIAVSADAPQTVHPVPTGGAEERWSQRMADCRSIARRGGGWIETTGGVAPRATLVLPVRKARREPAGSSARILLMDDEPGVCQVARRILEGAGHEVVSASDGAQAIERFEQARTEGRPFDLAILDLTVPEGHVGGEEAGRRMLELDPGFRVILSSGYSAGHAMRDWCPLGFQGALPKPYRADEMRRAVARAIAEEPTTDEA